MARLESQKNRQTARKFEELNTFFGQPINTLRISVQNPILDHVTPDSCGVIVVLGDNRVEFLLGILGGGG
jgi:hypothetical protein